MPATAIDIGTYAVKVVTAEPGKNPGVLRVVETINPYSVGLPTDDLQTEQIGELVNNIIFDNKNGFVCLNYTNVELYDQTIYDQELMKNYNNLKKTKIKTLFLVISTILNQNPS